MRKLNQQVTENLLSGLPIRDIYFFDSIDSTNDEAARIVRAGEKNFILVVADEQTSGKGRSGRRWYTPGGSAIAFSLVLEPGVFAGLPAGIILSRMTGLGAIAVCDVLEQMFSLEPKIKWPNDVLVNGKKLAGVLVEMSWKGDQLDSVILGLGLNVYRASLPPEGEVRFPATCVEETMAVRYVEGFSLADQPEIDRTSLLCEIIISIFNWIGKIHSEEIRNRWEELLAYRGEVIHINYPDPPHKVEGVLSGLGEDCCLQIRDLSGNMVSLYIGEVFNISRL